MPSRSAPTDDASAREALRAEVEALAAAGRYLDAVDLLTAAAHERRDASLEQLLPALRHAAVRELPPTAPRQPWPPRYADPFPDLVESVPEIPAGRLDAPLLGGAIVHHGCLALRGLLDRSVVDRLVAHIDGAMQTIERWKADRSVRSDDYVPFDPEGDDRLERLRGFVSGHGCHLISDAPSAMFELLDALRATSVLDVIGEYLGERPVMSIDKSTFRLTRPSTNQTGWHQDGAFIGDGARAVNIWMPLTDCGGEATAPGLNLFPRRVEQIFEPTGPPVPHQVGSDDAIRLTLAGPHIRPAFAAGDALLFDELLVHGTAQGGRMDTDRYGIEFWLFAPSSFPDQYVPMVV